MEKLQGQKTNQWLSGNRRRRKWLTEKGKEETLEEEGLFYILIVVIFMQLYAFGKTYRSDKTIKDEF